ncbi:nitrite reductase small subunit NirD [Salsuginibacillus kocurii]|uniref:nitrite reductase small subunit NirD n=1 Tax=Salsuginibacillus kocurii TaxID=427078 RepID=UPI00035E1F19|nr:nitrite reductase small subunit NirD [Salsuginibacillus kocurii]
MSSVQIDEKHVYVLPFEELRVNVPREIMWGETSIAVFKTNKDEVHAIENSCPHRGGPLSQGIVSGDHVFCPLHDWKINVTDGQVQAPDEGCVKTFDTAIIDGAVYLIDNA